MAENEYKLNKSNNEEASSTAPNDWYMTGIGNYETTSGDGGYLDSFNSLKQQVDYTYELYRTQYANLEKRRSELTDRKKRCVGMVWGLILTPVICCLFLLLFLYLGTLSGFFGIFYLFFLIVTPIATVTCIVFMLPAGVRDMKNALWQNKILNSENDEKYKEYRAEKNIISFEEERDFLQNKLKEYEDFYNEVDLFMLDKKDGSLQIFDTDTMTDEQLKILDKMRSLTMEREYKASTIETRKEAGPFWLVIGLAIFINLIFFYLKITFKNL